MIKLDSITAGYGNHTVLKALSATFQPATLTAVIGINGCGKSTLLKTALGMLPLTGGSITLDGCSLSAMSRKDIAKKIAYLPQTQTAADMTVEQLVLHGRFPHLRYPHRYTRQDFDIAHQAMEQTGIADLAEKQLNTLSGGMQQTAGIAMALAQETDYILLDEPTTYLDISHQLQLMKTLKSLAETGKGIVAVMHDLPLAFNFADQILVLDDGQLVGSGSAQQLCSQPLIADIFGVSVAKAAEGYHYRHTF